MKLSKDLKEFVELLNSKKVKYVILGGYAVAYHGYPRYTGDIDLYHQLQNQEGNLFFSPYSISTALAMTHAGARGKMAEQMAKALHFELDQQRLHPAFARIVTRIAINLSLEERSIISENGELLQRYLLFLICFLLYWWTRGFGLMA